MSSNGLNDFQNCQSTTVYPVLMNFRPFQGGNTCGGKKLFGVYLNEGLAHRVVHSVDKFFTSKMACPPECLVVPTFGQVIKRRFDYYLIDDDHDILERVEFKFDSKKIAKRADLYLKDLVGSYPPEREPYDLEGIFND